MLTVKVAPTYVLLLAVETHACRCCFGSIVFFFARALNIEWGAQGRNLLLRRREHSKPFNITKRGCCCCCCAIVHGVSNFFVLSHNSHSMSVRKAWESTAGHTIRRSPQAQKRETHVSAVDSFLWVVDYCFLLVCGIRNEVLRDGTSYCVDKLIRANTWKLLLVSCYRIKPILSDQSQ